VSCHRPTDDATTENVEHDGEIQKAGPRRNVRDIGDPEFVRRIRDELAVDKIRRRSRVAIANSRDGRLGSPGAGVVCNNNLRRGLRWPLRYQAAPVTSYTTRWDTILA